MSGFAARAFRALIWLPALICGICLVGSLVAAEAAIPDWALFALWFAIEWVFTGALIVSLKVAIR